MASKIICSSCGAEVEESLPKCPYCDTMIDRGAQKEYMYRLEQVREEMEELKQVPKEAVKRELKNQGRRIRKIVLIVGILMLLLAALFLWEEHKYSRDNKADYIWGQQNFPTMSELYEQGKFEELEEMYYDALMDDKPVWNWEYYEDFIDWLEE